MEITRIDVPVEPIIVQRISSWTVCIDNALLHALHRFRGFRLPNETGGVLLGSYDMQRKLLYKNLRNGQFEDVSYDAGPSISTPVAARGCAFGDFDNDGDLDVVVNTVNDFPQLLRCDSVTGHNWIKIKTIGTKSNRSGIGARLRCVTRAPGEKTAHSQIDEVRSGGGYFSQNDLRVHFGIGKAGKVELLEIRWPSGTMDTFKDIKPNQVIFVKEGEGIVRTMAFEPEKSKKS